MLRPPPNVNQPTPTRNSNRAGLRWGGEWLQEGEENQHFLVTGSTGSGKTVTMRLLMQDALQSIGSDLTVKALIYDSKMDYLEHVAGMAPHLNHDSRFAILNPFDERGYQWDMARDVTGPASALQIASILVRDDEGETNPFFSRAARDIVYGVILAFTVRKFRWTLRDLILAVTSGPDVARKALLLSPMNANRVDSYFSRENNTTHSIRATLQTKLAEFEPLAAAWDSFGDRKLSLAEWLKQPGGQILILRSSPSARAAVEAMNRAIFERLVQLLLSEQDVERGIVDRSVWFFLDELRELGRLEGLRSLLNMGRSKGAAVCLGFQDIEGIKSVYGQEEALELIGQCGNKALLRLESADTAQWASTMTGIERVHVHQPNIQAEGGIGMSIPEMDRATHAPAEFMRLPRPSMQSGLQGFFKSHSQEKFERRRIDFSPRGPNPIAPGPKGGGGIANVRRTSEALQFLTPWKKGDQVGDAIVSIPDSTPRNDEGGGVSMSSQDLSDLITDRISKRRERGQE